MLRKDINKALAEATRAQDKRRLATLRLMNAAIKDRDIAARGNGNLDGIDDTEIQQLLQKMIKQRQDSPKIYEEAGRIELAQQESEEIEIINVFLPQQLSEDDVATAVRETVTALKAASMQDMGKVMGTLKEKYAGQMDFGKASGVVKAVLSEKATA